MDTIPTYDLTRFTTDTDAFVENLGSSYRKYGFCCVSHCGIEQHQIDHAYDIFRKFFELPTATKLRYHVNGKRGYTPYMRETAKGNAFPDLKEFWQIGREHEAGPAGSDSTLANPWPVEVKEFATCGRELYRFLNQLGITILQALSLYLRLPRRYFDEEAALGDSVLRINYYPPTATTAPAGTQSIRAAAHEDINLITLLMGASAGGLEVLGRDRSWIPITPARDAIVVNIGDMLQRLSNGVYPSTTHRVVNPTGANAATARISIPFFLHPRPELDLHPLPGCVTADNPLRYRDALTAGEYLDRRSREIKLY